MVQRTEVKVGNEAVSEIVGEFMMLTITVTIFVVFMLAVGSMLTRPQTEIVNMEATSNNDSTNTSIITNITHMGGDSVRFQDLGVVVNGAQVAYNIPLDINNNNYWDVGETIIVIVPYQSLDVIIYDKSRNVVLGNFMKE